MPKTHPLIKDRDWWRPGHVMFVSFPSSFPLNHGSLGHSSLGAPAGGQRRIVVPTVLCVGGVPKQNKMAIDAETENKFAYYLNSKCCPVPLEREC